MISQRNVKKLQHVKLGKVCWWTAVLAEPVLVTLPHIEVARGVFASRVVATLVLLDLEVDALDVALHILLPICARRRVLAEGALEARLKRRIWATLTKEAVS